MATKKTKPKGHAQQTDTHWLKRGMVEHELSAVRAKAMFQTFRIGVIGTAPLITHRFGEKAIRMIQEKQAGAVKRAGREARDPEADVASAAYMIEGAFGEEGARYGVPTAGFKHAAVACGRHVADTNMTKLKQQFFIVPDVGRLTEIWFEEVTSETDVVRLQGQTADLRYRPYFHGWHCCLTVRFWRNVISAEQVIQFLELGGSIDGICEWRQGKHNSGWAGGYSLISEADFLRLREGEVTHAEMLAEIQGEQS